MSSPRVGHQICPPGQCPLSAGELGGQTSLENLLGRFSPEKDWRPQDHPPTYCSLIAQVLCCQSALAVWRQELQGPHFPSLLIFLHLGKHSQEAGCPSCLFKAHLEPTLGGPRKSQSVPLPMICCLVTVARLSITLSGLSQISSHPPSPPRGPSDLFGWLQAPHSTFSFTEEMEPSEMRSLLKISCALPSPVTFFLPFLRNEVPPLARYVFSHARHPSLPSLSPVCAST